MHERYRQTDRETDNGLIAQGEPFYKRSPKNSNLLTIFITFVFSAINYKISVVLKQKLISRLFLCTEDFPRNLLGLHLILGSVFSDYATSTTSPTHTCAHSHHQSFSSSISRLTCTHTSHLYTRLTCTRLTRTHVSPVHRHVSPVVVIVPKVPAAWLSLAMWTLRRRIHELSRRLHQNTSTCQHTDSQSQWVSSNMAKTKVLRLNFGLSHVKFGLDFGLRPKC